MNESPVGLGQGEILNCTLFHSQTVLSLNIDGLRESLNGDLPPFLDFQCDS